MPEIVLATQNPGKIAELRSLLAPAGFAVLGLTDLADELGGVPPEPEETGRTFAENAAIKARAYARATGRLCLADDSGLSVDSLGGRPGVISSHYAFDGRTDSEAAELTREQRDARNNARLLADLENIPPEARTARFVCVMALADPGLRDVRPEEESGRGRPRLEKEEPDAGIELRPTGGEGRPPLRDGVLAVTEGVFEGRIGLPGEVPRGPGGFGYDPLFLVGPDFTRTSAELTKDEKNRLSHRGHAVRAMVERLRAFA